MRNSMVMVSGILLAMVVGLSGCKIVSATPDTEKVIDVRPGQTIEFKVTGFVNNPTSKAVWEVAKGNLDDRWPVYDTVLERSGTFKLKVDPDGEGTNRIRVRCVIYELMYHLPMSPPCYEGCWGWEETVYSKTWDIRILQDTAPVWQGDYHLWDSRDIELLKDYTTVSGSLFIKNLWACVYSSCDGDNLTNLEGIENLSSVGSLSLCYNGALTSLSGLEGLTSVGDYFDIEWNSSLCGSLAEDLRNQVLARGGIGGSIEIWGNKDCTIP